MRLRSLKLTSILAIALISSSCATTQRVPTTTVLPIPPELALPKIQADALMCLTDEAYTDLVLRDSLQSERIRTLENIIRSTH